MRPRGKVLLGVAAAIFCTSEVSAAAGSIRISFLDGDALTETVRILRENGCSQETADLFEARVSDYRGAGFNFDFSKFPAAERGFYSFRDVQHLVAALPHPLWKTEHDYQFNCFDTVILLANRQLNTSLKPDEQVGRFVITTRTTSEVVLGEMRTAREAFTSKYADWYRDATASLFPRGLHDERVCLTAALFRHHRLPTAVKEEQLGESVLETIRTDCRVQKLAFPRAFELVLKHQLDLPSRTFATTHAGLLFRRAKGYLYLEKAGGSGPFVRLDLEDRADLLIWLAAGLKGLEHEHTHAFVTFNDAKVERLPIGR